jgi:putative transposase
MAQRVVKRAYRYRFYPSPEQADLLNRTFGCVRKVYNLALEERSRVWALEQRRVTYVDTALLLTKWKGTDELAFLNDVSNVALQQGLRHLQSAFVNFWAKKSKYPLFKSKHRSRASASFADNGFSWRNGQLTLAKMADPLDIRWSRPLPKGARPSQVTVSKDSASRYHISILVEDAVETLSRLDRSVGLDAGLTSLLTLSTGEKITNPHHEKRDREKLARAQRALSRKQEGSQNRAKARVKVARIYARTADRRRDGLHKLSTRLIRENQTVIVEDLNVRNMVKNHSLARAISDASWSELRRQLEYKAAWYGRTVVAIDRWYPSSKTCSTCGRIVESLPLNVREWTCQCGATHDRDVNAAKNIQALGLSVLACGDGVRPPRS